MGGGGVLLLSQLFLNSILLEWIVSLFVFIFLFYYLRVEGLFSCLFSCTTVRRGGGVPSVFPIVLDGMLSKSELHFLF